MRIEKNIPWRLELDALSDTIFRMSLYPETGQRGSALNRYGFINENWPGTKAARSQKQRSGLCVRTRKANASVENGSSVAFTFRDVSGKRVVSGKIVFTPDGGYRVECRMRKMERLFGLGDQTRERIEHRGNAAEMWIRNVECYIPIPFLMSTGGYGVFCNTTCYHRWDLGKTDPSRWSISLPPGNVDLYFFIQKDLKLALRDYLKVTGVPVLPPKWSFGLWFLCRDTADAHEVIHDATNFRDRNIPCDVIGLEPGWMKTYYDYSVEKEWHPERFLIPGYKSPDSLIRRLKDMGFRFELWLCCDYDFSYEAERRVRAQPAFTEIRCAEFSEHDVEKDLRLSHPVYLDKTTKIDQSWFEHLKQFVDQGADLFKQDGSKQTLEHPDRFYAGNGMTDRTMHNLYPLLYSQQIHDGFREYTGKRPCCFTPNGWAGLQRYTGTWTGDTGGGKRTLAACLNLALSGHGLTTCDMNLESREGIHYGFLLPWAQVNSFAYFRQPWLLGKELYSVFVDYARLRSRLVPYIYTYAHIAHTELIPILRPVVLEYPEESWAAQCKTQFFLGRELLITAFEKGVHLPPGRWLDYWTGRTYEGPKAFRYSPPGNRGGGLFMRANSILALGPVRQYVDQHTDEDMSLVIFMDMHGSASGRLYDDNGTGFEYLKGEYTLRKFEARHDNTGKLWIETPEEMVLENITVFMPVQPETVFINGASCSSTWDQRRSRLDIELS